jgi:nucleotidyltransferase substrate binding protein (TIGR01987 family)
MVQAFEFTHELSWKVLKDCLEYRGATDLYGSRDVVRRAFSLGILEEGEVWMN